MIIKECNLNCLDTVVADIKDFFKVHGHEMGGILGSKGEIVDTIYLDAGQPAAEDVYVPDTKKLNSILANWAIQGIHFIGMIHSHEEREALSFADIMYAEQLMKNNNIDEIRMYLYIKSKEKIIGFVLSEE